MATSETGVLRPEARVLLGGHAGALRLAAVRWRRRRRIGAALGRCAALLLLTSRVQTQRIRRRRLPRYLQLRRLRTAPNLHNLQNMPISYSSILSASFQRLFCVILVSFLCQLRGLMNIIYWFDLILILIDFLVFLMSFLCHLGVILVSFLVSFWVSFTWFDFDFYRFFWYFECHFSVISMSFWCLFCVILVSFTWLDKY